MSKYPIIVIEGPDGSGKTTLAKKLEADYGFKYRHLTYRFKDRMHYYHWAALELCLKDAEHTPVVLDRWWPSELVYANVFRGGSKWPMFGRMLDRVALTHGLTYVYCIPSGTDAYYDRFDKLKKSRTEMYDSMSGVFNNYLHMFKQIPPRQDVLHYDIDTDGKDLSKYINELLMISDLNNYRAKKIVPSPQGKDRLYAGNTRDPTIMLIGDESKKKTRRLVWPFFEHANSSLWITKHLDVLGITENKLLWVNSYSHGTMLPRFLASIAEQCKPIFIVPMGNKAMTAVYNAGLMSSHALKHPQWYRRFDPSNMRDFEPLKEMVK